MRRTPDPARVCRHNAELRHVIRHPVGLRYFTLALKKEFSQENIDFWKQCEDFRAMAAKHDGDEVPPKELLLVRTVPHMNARECVLPCDSHAIRCASLVCVRCRKLFWGVLFQI